MPAAPRGAPTLRTKIRWRVQDVCDRFIKADGHVRDPSQFEEFLSEAIELVLMDHKVDLSLTLPELPKSKG